jgi:hypothetical protein
MKSDNEEVAASLCLKYGLRLGDDQRAPGDYPPLVPEERLENSEVLVIEDIILDIRGISSFDLTTSSNISLFNDLF